MTWYTGFYGSWKNGDVVKHIAGTYSRKEIFERAQQTADNLKVVVTVKSETPNGRGLKDEFFKVHPKISCNRNI